MMISEIAENPDLNLFLFSCCCFCGRVVLMNPACLLNVNHTHTLIYHTEKKVPLPFFCMSNSDQKEEAPSSTESGSGVDQRICAFIAKIQAKVPADKKLTAGVVVQLLSTKFQAQFPGVDFNAKVSVVEAELRRLQAPPPPPVVAKDVVAPLDSDNAEDDEEDEDDSDASEEVEEDEEEDEEDGSSSDDSSASTDSDDDGDSSHDADGAPAPKKHRVDATAAAAASGVPVVEDVDPSIVSSMAPEVRVSMMLSCLNKLSYRARKQSDGESAESYLKDCLIPLFTDKNLDPNEFGKSATKKYKLRKELNDLQADGGSLALDRSQRRGRWQVPMPAPQSDTPAPRPVFMDEEE